MELTYDVAVAILKEAEAGGFFEGEIPTDSEALFTEAEYWVDEAQKSWSSGNRLETIWAIMDIAGVAPVIPEDDKTQPFEAPANPGYSSGVPPRSSGGYSESDLREGEQLVSSHNLPIPKDFEDEPEDMPRDLTVLTDREVRRLSGIYNGYSTRVKYLLGLELSDLAQATHLRDNAYRVALRAVSRIDSATDKAKLKEVMDAEAREAEEFVKFDLAVLAHQKNVTTYKALVDIYSGNVDRLSREWTMRQDEYEKTR